MQSVFTSKHHFSYNFHFPTFQFLKRLHVACALPHLKVRGSYSPKVEILKTKFSTPVSKIHHFKAR